ncbi:MAG: hypothetical protein R3F19_31045 [Verrucomicrobiales bacterium]
MASKTPTATIVTACDSSFLWGALLLIVSLRFHKVNLPVHVFAVGFDEEHKRMITQFPDVTIYDSESQHGKVPEILEFTRNNLNLFKPRAMLTAVSDYMIWMDADCVVNGNVTESLIKDTRSFDIRFRGAKENVLRFDGYYGTGDVSGSIPKGILRKWQQDVGEREESQIKTAPSAFCLRVHKNYRPFIQKWEDFMVQLLSQHPGPINKNTSSYVFSTGSSLSDELALSALLAFSKDEITLGEFNLDKDLSSRLIHFQGYPKPWQGWNGRTFQHFDLVCSLVEWAQSTGYYLPPIPWVFKRRNKVCCYLQRTLDASKHLLKALVKMFLPKGIIRKLR